MTAAIFNTRPILNKWPEIVLHINLIKIDIVGICETWLNDNDVVILCNVPGYASLPASTASRTGVGVFLLIISTYKSSLFKSKPECVLEYLAMKVFAETAFAVILLYEPLDFSHYD